MAKVTMELIKELREKSQVGMMDCKRALIESDGDIEKAIEVLRKKGAAVATKRAGRDTNNGHIQACISPDFKSGALLKISCETDFSANTTTMKDFAKSTCEHILKANPSCVKDGDNCLMEQELSSKPGLKIKDHLNELIAKITENIQVKEFVRFELKSNGIVNAYIHPGSNLGVLIELVTDKEVGANLEELKKLSKDICMQIVVTDPLSIDPSGLEETTLEKERSIAKEILLKSGKPENMIDKIMEGKIKKFYEDVCLLNQKFIKNDKITIQEHINQIAKDTGLKIDVANFTRFVIGK